MKNQTIKLKLIQTEYRLKLFNGTYSFKSKTNENAINFVARISEEFPGYEIEIEDNTDINAY